MFSLVAMAILDKNNHVDLITEAVGILLYVHCTAAALLPLTLLIYQVDGFQGKNVRVLGNLMFMEEENSPDCIINKIL